MSALKLAIVIGTRPNFIKVTQFRKQCEAIGGLELHLIHTGQHYDQKMSAVFFEQFNLVPDHFLNIGPGSSSTQMAEIMNGLEKKLQAIAPDLVMVVGDVNSTLAAAITANKLQLPIAHLESGLRSGDRSMPEEINRIITDKITDHYFITEQSGLDHLVAEGQSEERMYFVGNTMIDTMLAYEEEIEGSTILNQLGIDSDYALITMHRPANVDDEQALKTLIRLLEMITQRLQLVFPMHPRTAKQLEQHGLSQRLAAIEGLYATEALDYFAFQKLIKCARFILTDSGGIQEESTYRKVPCLTLRPNTERPSTIDYGSNELVSFDLEVIKDRIDCILDGEYSQAEVPPLWDGQATARIVNVIKKHLAQGK